MFQTEYILYFQSFEQTWLTQFMVGITSLGYRNFIILFLAIVLFGIDFRKGFIIMQTMLWTALVTVFLKDYFGLPRPYHVDSRVKLLDGGLASERELHFVAMGAKTFWEGIPQAVISYYRNLSVNIPYGFPSGHTSMAVAIWGTTAWLFKPKWLKFLCLLLLVLVPFSRMYLGVHFLADVLGGYLIGIVLFWLLYLWVLKPKTLNLYLNAKQFPFKQYPVVSLLLLLSPLAVLPLVGEEAQGTLSTLWGMNIAFVYLMQRGLPISKAKIGVRALRVLIGIALFIGITALTSRILPSTVVWKFIGGTLGGVFFIGVSTEICLRIGLFKKAQQEIIRS